MLWYWNVVIIMTSYNNSVITKGIKTDYNMCEILANVVQLVITILLRTVELVMYYGDHF